jgi:hypothetical protein
VEPDALLVPTWQFDARSFRGIRQAAATDSMAGDVAVRLTGAACDGM